MSEVVAVVCPNHKEFLKYIEGCTVRPKVDGYLIKTRYSTYLCCTPKQKLQTLFKHIKHINRVIRLGNVQLSQTKERIIKARMKGEKDE